jgi:dTDP-4-dehydrorhamnose 3,5-epimerase
MPIKVEDTEIPDIKIIRSNRFLDDRGFFTETYKESEYLEIGIPAFVQDNMSESSRGVIRGLHWQESPYGQGKLVNCVTGSILDVAVDIRKNSSTFGKHVAIVLSAKEQIALWVPEGFAHGFQALEDGTRVIYKVTNVWEKLSERAINPISKEFAGIWQISNPTLSTKDLNAPSFREMFNARS